MKLNIDCIRDILLYLEDRTTYNSMVTIYTNKVNELVDKYGTDTIKYHISQCNQYGYLLGCRAYDGGNQFNISDITPKAHEFIANIRNEKNWNKTKNILGKIGSFALEIVEKVATDVITTQIKNCL